MKFKIVWGAAIAALSMFSQAPPRPRTPELPAPPQGAINQPNSTIGGDPCRNDPCACLVVNHSEEPIVISDGSVLLRFYGNVFMDTDTNNPQGLIADAGSKTESGTFTFASGVDINGVVKTGSASQPPAVVKSYQYDVEYWDSAKRNWRHQAFIDFSKFQKSAGFAWRIAPDNAENLRRRTVSSIAVRDAKSKWNCHTVTTYEYRAPQAERRLRVGSMQVKYENASQLIPLATGCSSFRIEPSGHIGHAVPPSENPCAGKRADPRKNYRTFSLSSSGVRPIVAIDVSEDLK